MNQALEYLQALDEVDPNRSDESVAEEEAFIFLKPSQLFRVWWYAFCYRHWPWLYGHWL